AARRLNLDVIVPGTAGVDCWHDGAKAERAVGAGDDMATVSEPDIVVFALLISVPEIDHRSAQRSATPGQRKAGQFKPKAPSAMLAQITALRRSWLKKWPLGLADGWFIAIVTGGRGCKLLPQDSVRTG